MSPLGGNNRAAAIAVAAGRIADDKLFSRRVQRIVAVMNRLTNAACMRWSGRGCVRQRADISRKREQQQKSGDPAMHTGEVPQLTK